MATIKVIKVLMIWSCILRSGGAEGIPDCDYFDTVDLTGSKRLESGAYEYEGVEIPVDQTGIYNYKILFEGTRATVEPHLRGCVCKFKACIRYCCHRHRLDLADDSKCMKELQSSQRKAKITLPDGTETERNVSEQFIVQQGIRIRCEKPHHKVAFPWNSNWKLFENGTLFRSDDEKYLSKRDYCVQPQEIAATGMDLSLLPMNCLNDHSLLFVNLCSLLFLLLTILIYIFVLKINHIHDKCYLCYLGSLTVSLLVNIWTSIETSLLGLSCYFVAYLGYFSSMSIYLWLVVLGFDLWRKLVVHLFEAPGKGHKMRFFWFNLFVWGSAMILLLITILADFLLDKMDIDSSWKMGYAYYECFAKLTDWSGVLYFFAPAMLLVVCNVVMVLFTAKHVYFEIRRNREQLSQFGKHNVKNQMRFVFYVRFFIIAIMDWLIELSAAVFNLAGHPPAWLRHIMFYLGLTQCILIFAVTVLRRDVLQLLKRRRAVPGTSGSRPTTEIGLTANSQK